MPQWWAVSHALLTRAPLNPQVQAPASSVRLACLRPAASVRSEPGSNSQVLNNLLVSPVHIKQKLTI
ncbi:MAG: hypothetical protein E7011_00005 [Alphaproteobacteria bacterium]|nr:hypothetical protein [Alphaproteobacteria bacterium]